MPSLEDLKVELEFLAKIREPAERAVLISSVVAEALRIVGQDPILVGGAAVEFYTQGAYTTADIDLVSLGGPDLWKTMKGLGFERIGKDFLNKKAQIYIEFPGSNLKPSERVNEITLKGRKLRIISIEDLIIDRLCAYKFWKSAVDGMNALMLLEQSETNEGRVEQRANEEDVADALKVVRQIKEEVIRKRLRREEADRLIEAGIKRLAITPYSP